MQEKWYNQTWIWTMLIFLVLIIFLIKKVVNCYCTLPVIFINSNIGVAISSVATFVSVIVAIVSIHTNNKRIKNQSTLEEYDRFKDIVREYENKIHDYKSLEVNRIIEEHKNNEKKINTGEILKKEEWNEIKNYLAHIERFAVGINSNVFNVELVDKVGGYFIYEQYIKLYPIIKFKREKDNNPRIYEEFTKMVNSIIKVRYKRKNNKYNYVE